jgi:enamine deaminase RidA (YjgF/YER057c/UK114 family)
MKIEYFVAEASSLADKGIEIADVLDKIDCNLSKLSIKQTQIVRLTVFYNPSKKINYLEQLSSSIKNYFKYALPAVSYIAQPPFGGRNVCVEVSYVADKKAVIVYKKHKNIFYTLLTNNTEKHIFISGLQSLDTQKNMEEQSEDVFQALEYILEQEGFVFTDIIRQWNYIQDIIVEKDGNQNYQLFNDVRTKYYIKNGLNSNYPAATGIGIKEGGLVLEVHALKPSKDMHLSEISNPLQTNAYAYSEKVLAGKPIVGYQKKTTPKFSRAKWVDNSSYAQVLVSGTASIHGEETIGINNIEKQTHFTIKNIYQLIDKEHFATLNTAYKTASYKFEIIRVYVKNANDIDKVRKVCSEYFTTPNIIFIEADICRDNLLVEIEGVVSFKLVN